MLNLSEVVWEKAIRTEVTFYDCGTLLKLKSGEVILVGDHIANDTCVGGCGCCSRGTNESFGPVVEFSIIFRS